MLKVTVHDERGAPVRIRLEGKITAAWTSELETCWRSLLPGHVVVDLSEVDYADAAGRYLLAWMKASGVDFVSCSLPMRELLDGVHDTSVSKRRLRGPTTLVVILTLVHCATVGARAEPLRLTLRRAVEIASSPEGSTRIQLADEAVRQAEARAKQQRASLLPNVDGYLAYQSQTRNLAAFGIRIQSPIPGLQIPRFVGPFSTVDVRANFSQSVFDLASIRRYQSSKAVVQGVRADREYSSDQVAATVVRAYLTALKADADVETAQANVDLAAAVVKQVEEQKAAGTGVGIEVTRARVQLANERQRLLVAGNDRRRAGLNLLRAVGLRLDTEVELEGKLGYEPESDAGVAEAIRRALKERGDYKAQQERERSADLASSATRWERLPSVAAVGDYGSLGTGLDNALPTRTAGFQIRIPVFDGGRRDYRRAEAASQTRQERTRTRDLREQIELEVRLALDTMSSAREQVSVAQEGLRLSEDELASARRRYSAGVSTSVEITDAQTRLERARDNYVAALYAWNLARVDLAQAQGVIEEVVK